MKPGNALYKILIFGNSGSGKTTLASKIASSKEIAHLDLDTLAWKPTSPPERLPINVSGTKIEDFITGRDKWIIEGCYTDLLEIAAVRASHMIFMNLPVGICTTNAENRPWEPHKYESKTAQDENLGMLLEWIKQYYTRTDTFSYSSHRTLFNRFQGAKVELLRNEQSEMALDLLQRQPLRSDKQDS